MENLQKANLEMDISISAKENCNLKPTLDEIMKGTHLTVKDNLYLYT